MPLFSSFWNKNSTADLASKLPPYWPSPFLKKCINPVCSYQNKPRPDARAGTYNCGACQHIYKLTEKDVEALKRQEDIKAQSRAMYARKIAEDEEKARRERATLKKVRRDENLRGGAAKKSKAQLEDEQRRKIDAAQYRDPSCPPLGSVRPGLPPAQKRDSDGLDIRCRGENTFEEQTIIFPYKAPTNRPPVSPADYIRAFNTTQHHEQSFHRHPIGAQQHCANELKKRISDPGRLQAKLHPIKVAASKSQVELQHSLEQKTVPPVPTVPKAYRSTTRVPTLQRLPIGPSPQPAKPQYSPHVNAVPPVNVRHHLKLQTATSPPVRPLPRLPASAFAHQSNTAKPDTNTRYQHQVRAEHIPFRSAPHVGSRTQDYREQQPNSIAHHPSPPSRTPRVKRIKPQLAQEANFAGFVLDNRPPVIGPHSGVPKEAKKRCGVTYPPDFYSSPESLSFPEIKEAFCSS